MHCPSATATGPPDAPSSEMYVTICATRNCVSSISARHHFGSTHAVIGSGGSSAPADPRILSSSDPQLLGSSAPRILSSSAPRILSSSAYGFLGCRVRGSPSERSQHGSRAKWLGRRWSGRPVLRLRPDALRKGAGLVARSSTASSACLLYARMR
jgi:hypothetical protein